MVHACNVKAMLVESSLRRQRLGGAGRVPFSPTVVGSGKAVRVRSGTRVKVGFGMLMRGTLSFGGPGKLS